jgi:hypothetical protein
LIEDSGRELGEPSDEEQAADERSGEYEAMSNGVGLKSTRQVLSATSETDEPEHQGCQRREQQEHFDAMGRAAARVTQPESPAEVTVGQADSYCNVT